MRKWSALGAVGALLVSLAALGANFAYASIKGVAANSSTVAVSSGTWAVAAVSSASATTLGTQPYSFSTAAVGNYFSLRNFGSFDTVKVTISLTAGTTGSATNLLQSCSTTWNETTGGCNSSGTIKTILTVVIGGSSPTANPVSAVYTLAIQPFAVNSTAGVRLRVLAGQTSKTDSISVSITNSGTNAGIRAATTTNS